MIKSLELGPKKTWPLYIMIWGIAFTFLYSSVVNTDIVSGTWNPADFEDEQLLISISLTTHQLIAYLAVLLLLYHYDLINEKTMQLAKSFVRRKRKINSARISVASSSAKSEFNFKERDNFRSFSDTQRLLGYITEESKDSSQNADSSVADGELQLNIDVNHQVQPRTAPAQVEIPRKAKLFRVLMERKLGIDWEHDEISSQMPESLQTNQV